jgi:hypothetical protein
MMGMGMPRKYKSIERMGCLLGKLVVGVLIGHAADRRR